jgi:superfamily II DNA or RNA helicase
MKTLRDYQQTVHDDTIQHMKTTQGTDPVVVDASVGAGKSLLIANLCKHVADKGGKAMVLARQGELAEQNSSEAWEIGLENSKFSASLGCRSTRHPVIFGTEGTVARALNKELAGYAPDLLCIDESHMVAYDNPETQFMQIIEHFKRIKPKMRIVGMTGSPYRGITSIVGQFWKKKVGNISTEYLIENGWLVPPVFGFPLEENEGFNFGDIETRNGSAEFDEKQLNAVVLEDKTLTHRIMHEVVERGKDRHGVLIFSATKRHTKEVRESLLLAGVDDHQIGIITESTKNAVRRDILARAKAGDCRYVINVGVLTTGVNIPRWDLIVYLRPIGSLVLLVQSLGRGLRLCEETGKTDALILDYAGVMSRLGHLYDSPMLEEAQLQKAKIDHDMIQCPKCETENSKFARRCMGKDLEQPDLRCDFFWQSQKCKQCDWENDISAVECRNPGCRHELRDPNAQLLHKAYSDDEMVPVVSMKITSTKNRAVMVQYILHQKPESGWPTEFYAVENDKMARVWRARFVSAHVRDPAWRSRVMSMRSAETIVKNQAVFDAPTHIAFRVNEKGHHVVGRKRFISGRMEEQSSS